jgi:hypothetical protein
MESLVLQIKNHFEWIKNNKEKANKLAKCSHETFLTKFTMEQQLLNLSDNG